MYLMCHGSTVPHSFERPRGGRPWKRGNDLGNIGLPRSGQNDAGDVASGRSFLPPDGLSQGVPLSHAKVRAGSRSRRKVNSAGGGTHATRPAADAAGSLILWFVVAGKLAQDGLTWVWEHRGPGVPAQSYPVPPQRRAGSDPNL